MEFQYFSTFNLAQQLIRLVTFGSVRYGCADTVQVLAQRPVLDAGAPELGTRRIDQGFKIFVDDRLYFDLEQQMRAAAQIQAQIDLFRRQPVRYLLVEMIRHEIRRGKNQSHKAD